MPLLCDLLTDIPNDEVSKSIQRVRYLHEAEPMIHVYNRLRGQAKCLEIEIRWADEWIEVYQENKDSFSTEGNELELFLTHKAILLHKKNLQREWEGFVKSAIRAGERVEELKRLYNQ